MIRDTSKLVWAWAENEEGMHSSLHCYYGRQRKFWGEKYSGNSTLCNKKKGISQDGDTFISIDEIQSSALDESKACKRCLKIYHNLYEQQSVKP